MLRLRVISYQRARVWLEFTSRMWLEFRPRVWPEFRPQGRLWTRIGGAPCGWSRQRRCEIDHRWTQAWPETARAQPTRSVSEFGCIVW